MRDPAAEAMVWHLMTEWTPQHHSWEFLPEHLVYFGVSELFNKVESYSFNLPGVTDVVNIQDYRHGKKWYILGEKWSKAFDFRNCNTAADILQFMNLLTRIRTNNITKMKINPHTLLPHCRACPDKFSI
jgi:hypothetical protein